MQKSAPSVGRIFVMVAFALSCFGLILFLWVAFGGSVPLAAQGYRFHVLVPEATQLAQQADVRISGVSVGKVVKLDIGPRVPKVGDTTDATIQIDRKYAPVAQDTVATLRQKTLLGETYVELTPGHGTKIVNGKLVSNALPDGGTLHPAQVKGSVQLDEIFRAFNEKTRLAFQTWMQTQALAFAGRGLDLNDALGNLPGFADETTKLLRILDTQKVAVRRLVRNTGVVFDALSERDGQLASLIRNSNTVFRTTDQRNRDLQALFVVLPTFQRESIATLNRLTRFAIDANPLVTQLRPAAVQLTPTLEDLERLAPDLLALFRDLNPLITASKAGLPALESFLHQLQPLLGQFPPLLRQLNPILSFVGLYKHELTAFFANTVASSQATDFPAKAKGPVHYLRTSNPVNAENLAVYNQRIGANRPNAYTLPLGFKFLAHPNLKVFENRQCGGVNPQPPTAPPLIPNLPIPVPGVPTLTQLITSIIFVGGTKALPAPPCVKQPKFPAPYNTVYPHVTAEAP